MRIYAAFVLLLCALALCLSACGGSDSTASTDGGSTSASSQVGSPSQAEGPTISKAALIKQGDAICTKTDAAQRTALKKYEKENPVKLTTEPAIEASLRQAALPPIATEIGELEALGAPAGDEADMDAILSGFQEALKTSEEDPSTLMGTSGEGPFAAPDKLAAAYGFKACSKAL